MRVEIYARQILEEPWTAQPTLFIVAPWKDDAPKTWEKIVVSLKKFVDSLLIGSAWQDIDMAVEMVAVELALREYSAPVVGNQELEEDWLAIERMTLSTLGPFPQTQGCMTSIGLFDLSYNEIAVPNPIAVYISMDYDCPEDTWPPIFAEIRIG
ncbi:hypothetical protein CDD81_5221 [Ophiocordyceps australis]|uniref:Uncharacterized protein n=1 Tax=Ophiocordyceps australis TaxID=1399860 RepID=A0A2C5XC49_9HYPO|nr:hypothetical protein CDD81_5221 [Ophiocordyceps australis]